MEMLRSQLAARNVKPGHAAAIFHAEPPWHDAIAARRHDFYTRLEAVLAAHGITSYLVQAGTRVSDALLEARHLHILSGQTPRYGAGMLHARPGPVWGFWHLDECGIGADGSLRFARFVPEEIDADKAAYFFDGVTGHMLRANVSSLPQEPRMDAPFSPAFATVFCQQIEDRHPRAHYLTTAQMIHTAAQAAGAQKVRVKPHPHQSRAARAKLATLCEEYDNVTLSDASVHDLIEASRVVVTQNSAAGFEALMQRKPVITCAKSDYWHATLSPRSIDDLRAALAYGPEAMAAFDYSRYLYWYLGRQCLEPADAAFERRVWARLCDKMIGLEEKRGGPR